MAPPARVGGGHECRQLARGLDADPLETGLFPADQFDPGLGDMEKLGQKAAQMGVGLALHWRGGEPDLEVIAGGLADGVSAGARLHPQAELQVVAVPAIPVCPRALRHLVFALKRGCR